MQKVKRPEPTVTRKHLCINDLRGTRIAGQALLSGGFFC
jgi:hypothetical protein